MPLIKSPTKSAFSKNVSTEMNAGQPQKKSLAIAYSVQKANRKKKKMADGGPVPQPSPTPQADNPFAAGIDKEKAKKFHPFAKGGEVRGLSEEDVGDEYDRMLHAHLSDEEEGNEDLIQSHYAHGGQAPKLGSGKRFENLEHSVAHEKGIHDPAALAAAIGRKKYGAEKMAKMAAAGRHADGGMIDPQEKLDEMHHMSLAERILHKKREHLHMMAEGGMVDGDDEVDLNLNAKEMPNNEDDLSYDALHHDTYAEDAALDEMHEPEDSNLHGGEEHDEHDKDMISRIMSKMRSKRMR